MLKTKLREAREGLGLSLRDVAADVGISAGQLSKIETGKTTPGQAVARALHDRYAGDVSLGEIYDALGPFSDRPGASRVEVWTAEERRHYRKHGRRTPKNYFPA